MTGMITFSNDSDIVAAIAADKKTAEQYLLCYDQLLAEYQKQKAKSIESKKHIYRGKNVPPNPTADQALRSAEYDMDNGDYMWLHAVEVVERTLDDETGVLLGLRRKAYNNQGRNSGKPAWVTAVQMGMLYGVGKLYSESSIKRKWRDIITRVVIVKNKMR